MCILLSGLSLDGIDNPDSRMTLVGAQHFAYPRTFFRDWSAIQMTEVFEHAKQMQDSQFLLPHFQAYKLWYAFALADFGFVEEARK